MIFINECDVHEGIFKWKIHPFSRLIVTVVYIKEHDNGWRSLNECIVSGNLYGVQSVSCWNCRQTIDLRIVRCKLEFIFTEIDHYQSKTVQLLWYAQNAPFGLILCASNERYLNG